MSLKKTKDENNFIDKNIKKSKDILRIKHIIPYKNPELIENPIAKYKPFVSEENN